MANLKKLNFQFLVQFLFSFRNKINTEFLSCENFLNKMRYFLAISIFLAFVFSTNAFGRRFIAVENCTSSGKIATIRKCLINDNKFTLLITVNPLNANTTKTVVNPFKMMFCF